MTNRSQAKGRPGPAWNASVKVHAVPITGSIAWVVPPGLGFFTVQQGPSLIVSTLKVPIIKPGPACGALSKSGQGQFSMSKSHVSSEQACSVHHHHPWNHSQSGTQRGLGSAEPGGCPNHTLGCQAIPPTSVHGAESLAQSALGSLLRDGPRLLPCCHCSLTPAPL